MTDYEQFRDVYPACRRVGGLAGRRAFSRSGIGSTVALETVLAALEQHKRSEQWQTPRLIPLMTTWLNQERWLQTLPEAPQSAFYEWTCPHDPPHFGRNACRVATEIAQGKGL